ncbi:MAG: peptidoglycan DD-metalloendopeptidase family protein [Bacteroidales bacterium]|nr:peptidoglycan DD-metalloendopeptidase family protein [Bacteroidales bacterium]
MNAAYSGTYVDSSFTGKEKDSESGFHYFGARYYDSEALTGWLSVDPMADKYPSVSPYNYCAWNPMIFVDPDGNIPWRSLVNGFGNKVPSSVPMSARLQPKMNKFRPHHGLDMPAVKGAAVNSAASGTVIFAGNMNGYGNAVIVNHGKGFYTLYAHLNSIAVQLNDEISNGQQIGQVGETGGVSTGPHLHVEYMYVSGEGNSICNVSRLFKNKNSLVFDPRSVNDLQNIIDGNECGINVPFLDGHTTTLGNIEILSRGNNASFNQAPEPKFSEKLQNNKVPIIKTLGDIISHLE